MWVRFPPAAFYDSPIFAGEFLFHIVLSHNILEKTTKYDILILYRNN